MVAIIDGAHLAYRSYHTFNTFTTSKGYPTGMIYGFFSILNSYSNKFFGKVIVAWEGGDNWRTSLYPEYKMKRESDDEITQGFKDVQRLCTLAGLLQVKKRGYEADDLISFLVRRLGSNLRIISGDKDLIQLIDDKRDVLLVRPRKEGLVEFREADVFEEFNISKDNFVKYLAIMGDKSDNIKGIRGFGPVKTSNLINNTLDPVDEIKKMYPNNSEMINMNLKLINLLNPETMIRNIDKDDIIWEQADIVSLNSNLHFYEIRNYNAKDIILNLARVEDQKTIYDKIILQSEYRF